MPLCPEYWPILPPCFGSWPLQPHQQDRYNRKTRKLLQKPPSSILSQLECWKQEANGSIRRISKTSQCMKIIHFLSLKLAVCNVYTCSLTFTVHIKHMKQCCMQKTNLDTCNMNGSRSVAHVKATDLMIGDRFRKHQSATHKPHSRCTTWTKKLFGIAVVLLSILPFHLFLLRLILLLLVLLLFFFLLLV